ncbi:MAG: F0F1 ATP synthase subunit A [Flavobacteriales bacterium]|nr:F0F1 ATP synthase subunit A [Flavobacteriales bacterium]
MKTTLKSIVLFTALLATNVNLFAGGKDAEHENKEEFDAVEVIMHHIADAHEFHILDYVDDSGVEHPVSMPLPVILFTDGNLDLFMSSAFDHGHADVVCGDRTYRLDHGHIVELGGLHPIDFSITKNVFSMFLSLVIILLIFITVGRSYRKGNGVPKGLASFMEPLVLFVRDDIAVPNIGKKADKFLPYLLTVFFFIWINNLIGLVPFFPGSSNLTGNISFTITLAFITFLITNLNGNKDYWKHVFATPGVPVWLAPIMIPVEVMGILAKPVALLIRLFANITAGHIIILSLISLIFIFKTIMIAPVSVGFVLFMNVLELLVAALQAYIFTLLSALFIGMAVAEHEHH